MFANGEKTSILTIDPMVYVAKTRLELPRPEILGPLRCAAPSREKQPMQYRRPRSAPITTNFVGILTRLQCTNRRKNYDWTSRKVCGSAPDSHEKPTERGRTTSMARS